MKKFDINNFFQKYKGDTIMKEGIGDTYMILREKEHWYEKIIPDFLIPNPIVLVRGIKSMEDAKLVIDMAHSKNFRTKFSPLKK